MKILIIIAILLQSIAYATGPKTDAIQAAVNYVFDQEDNAEKAQEIFLQLLLSSKSSVDFSNSINVVNEYIHKRDESQRNEFNYLQLNASLQTFCSNIKDSKLLYIHKVGSTLLISYSTIFSLAAAFISLRIHGSNKKYARILSAALMSPMFYAIGNDWIMDNVNYPEHMDHNLPSVCN